MSNQASSVVDSAVAATNKAANKVESAVESARDQVQPTVARLAAQAEAAAKRSLDAVRDGASSVREHAHSVGDATVRYVRDEPVKSILIAAAAGAALMALLSVIQSGRRNH